jgi:hypothetical protein
MLRPAGWLDTISVPNCGRGALGVLLFLMARPARRPPLSPNAGGSLGSIEYLGIRLAFCLFFSAKYLWSFAKRRRLPAPTFPTITFAPQLGVVPGVRQSAVDLVPAGFAGYTFHKNCCRVIAGGATLGRAERPGSRLLYVEKMGWRKACDVRPRGVYISASRLQACSRQSRSSPPPVAVHGPIDRAVNRLLGLRLGN